MIFISYKYTYLIGTILFMIPWIAIFITRKDLRKEMIPISLLGGVISVVTGYVWWTIDWWLPQTITGTRVGFEDFILGWANGGVGAVLYETVHRTRIIQASNSDKLKAIYLVVTIVSFTALFYTIGGMTTFFASSLALICGIAWVMQTHPQFNKVMVLNGMYMVAISVPVYILCEFVSPGWIHKTWMNENLSGLTVLNIPIEDLYFYLLAGMVTWPMSKIWHKLTLIRY